MIYSYNTDWVLKNTNFGGVLPTEVARVLRRRIYFGRLKTYLAVGIHRIKSQPYMPQKWNCNMILMFFQIRILLVSSKIQRVCITNTHLALFF